MGSVDAEHWTKDERSFQIYVLCDITADAYYVGSAWSRPARERFLDHMQGRRGGARLVAERVALGHEFKQDVLEDGVGNWPFALNREEWWLQHLVATEPDRTCLNINMHPGRGARSPMTDEEKAKRSERYKGKPRPGGTPWLIGRPPALKGKKNPAISAAKKGIPRPPHVLAAMAEAGERRYVCLDCDMFTNAMAMQHHLDASGHSGKRLAESFETPSPRTLKTRHPIYSCDECDLITTAAGVAAHQRMKGHSGRTFVEQATEFVGQRLGPQRLGQ